MSIADNLARVRERIAAAAHRAGRSPDSVALMAVTKTFPPDVIRQAYDAGQRLFGENRVQEFGEKYEALCRGPVSLLKGQSGGGAASFHLIGHLQTNKANRAAEIFNGVDSVDSIRLGEKLNAAAQKLGKRLPVLIELNLGGEESKSGLAADSPELDRALQAAAGWPNLEIRGLMAIPPFTEDPESARPFFRVLRQMRDRIAAQNLPAARMDVLSMGMSHDFEVAIEEGSTCVRLGIAIFGARMKP